MIALSMLQTASVLLLLTAAGGAAMAARRLIRKVNPPSWLAMAHGFLAASALTLLVYAGLVERIDGRATLGLVFLVVGSAGGVMMNLIYHLASKLLPIWLLQLHIAFGTIGTGLVLWGAWVS